MMHRANALPPDKLEALIAVRDGGHVTRAQIQYLIDGGWLDKDGRTFTIKGAGELNRIDEAGGGGTTPGSD